MKRYDNHGVCHAFAHAEPGESGQSHNGNLFFTGNTLYSYGAHYPVALIVSRADRVALFNADSSSVTTEGKHKNPARRALSHFTLHRMPDLDDIARGMRGGKLTMPRSNLCEYVQARADAMQTLDEKFARLRSDWTRAYNRREHEMHENAARVAWRLAGRRGDCFNVASRETRAELKRRAMSRYEMDMRCIEQAAAADVAAIVADLDAKRDTVERATHMRDILGRAPSEDETTRRYTPTLRDGAARVMGRAWTDRVETLQRETAQRNAPILEAAARLRGAVSRAVTRLTESERREWQRGEREHIGPGTPMTLRIFGDTLETSARATVPLPDAIALTRAAAACRARGRAWKRNGERKRVGQFECDAISARGDIVAGCHRIPWQAIVDCVAVYRDVLPDSLKNAVLDAESVE